jgi:hypothetical protein
VWAALVSITTSIILAGDVPVKLPFQPHNQNQPSQSITWLPICHPPSKLFLQRRASGRSETFKFRLCNWTACTASMPFASSGNIRSQCQSPCGREIGMWLSCHENSTWCFLRCPAVISAGSNANIVRLPNIGGDDMYLFRPNCLQPPYQLQHRNQTGNGKNLSSQESRV